ncbi:MAG: mannose-1-phosphate guanylyltransferase/mannose-6-phosphate isomerase [Cellvibrionaceae bacterium]
MLIPVILAGGSGSRLWPLSRQQFPKQFLSLFGEHSMLQQTLLRLNGLEGLSDPIIVCNEDHRFTVAEQLQKIGIKGSIVLEPIARNTAPAITLAAMLANDIDPDAKLLVLAADHLIKDVDVFQAAVTAASQCADKGNLVTFGVVPTRPETGYGYINTDKNSGDVKTGLKTKRFVEKPDLKTAEKYLADGNYFWNSGMFVFTAAAFLNSLQEYNKECFNTVSASLKNKTTDIDFIRVDKEEFSKAPDISVDYAVMEKAKNVYCIPLDAGWSDVGCWRSYWDAQEKDENGNSLVGDAMAISTKNTLIYSKDKLVSTIGVENLVVVNTADAVLVIDKKCAQDVKSAIELLKKEDRSEHITHREVHRPWGAYDSIDNGERFQVKRITVKPGASLSLQMHHHRAEHWIVVSGTAIVQKGDEELMLSENQSTYIPLGVTHRLTNPGRLPLELIEVQSGSYLGEDDIVRFDDTYGRV